MKSWKLAIVICLALGGVRINALRAEQMRIADLSGGMVSYLPPNRIPDNAAALLQNVYTDADGMIVQRRPVARPNSAYTASTQSSSSVQGMFTFTSTAGVNYFVLIASGVMYTSNTNGGTPTSWALNWSTDTRVRVRGATNLGVIMLTDGVDAPITFNGVSTAVVTGAQRGSLIAAWRNRFVIAAATNTRSSVYFSADGDATNWTVGGNPTDAFILQIGGASDGLKINCMTNYMDDLVYGRTNDMWGTQGFDQNDIVTRKISSDYGCIDQGSIQEIDNSLIWFANRFAIVQMRGINIQVISNPIRNYIENIVRNNVSSSTRTGISLAAPMASAVYDGRYYLSTTSTTTPVTQTWNDLVLCFQRNGTWTTHTGIRLSAFTVYRDNALYAGEAKAGSTGTFMYYEWEKPFPTSGTMSAYDENPDNFFQKIEMVVQTKSYDLGAPHRDKNFRQAWVSFPAQSTWTTLSLNMTYSVDQTTTSYSLGSATMSDETATTLAKFPFPLSASNVTYGREIQLRLARSTANDNVGELPRIYDIVLDYTVIEPR